LHPLTQVMSKQVLPVYDKPMIYYPLSMLMLAGIREVLIISTPRDLPGFQALLGDGSRIGLSISYAEQPKPDGLPQAFVIGENFIGGDSVALILGDNMMYGSGLSGILQGSKQKIEAEGGMHIFGYHVPDPERFGIVSFDDDGNVTAIEEKPQEPRSHFAIPGVYFCDNQVATQAKQLTPSPRGETEITDLHRRYLAAEQLTVTVLPRGIAWLDAGTHTSLLQAANFVQIVEERQGLKIGCIEEVAYRMGYIGREQLVALGEELKKSGYGEYLLTVAADQHVTSGSAAGQPAETTAEAVTA
jgi:glucose-1-phosphate thymidylyltransferase